MKFIVSASYNGSLDEAPSSVLGPSTWTFSLALGLAVGCINEVSFLRGNAGIEPERIRLSLITHGRRPSSWSRRLKKHTYRFATGFLSGLTFGLAFMLIKWLIDQGAGHPWYYTAPGLAFGTAVGMTNILVSALGENYIPGDTSPWATLNSDRAVTCIRTTATIALAFAFGVGIQDGIRLLGTLNVLLTNELFLALGAAIGIARLALSSWGTWLLCTRLWLPLTGRMPWRPKRFLEDAYERGVLRTIGAVYQFRHTQLRDRLADRT